MAENLFYYQRILFGVLLPILSPRGKNWGKHNFKKDAFKGLLVYAIAVGDMKTFFNFFDKTIKKNGKMTCLQLFSKSVFFGNGLRWIRKLDEDSTEIRIYIIISYYIVAERRNFQNTNC